MAERISPTDTATPSGGATKVVPKFFSRDIGGGLPHLDRSPPYILAHHPNRYMVMAGKLVPSPSRIPLVDGVNRVRIASDGRIRFADAQSRLQDAHFKLIPYEMGPDGESYIQEVDSRPDGREAIAKTTISVWETAYAGDSSTEVDTAGYAEWLESLVTRGHLPACPTHQVARMLTTARAALKDAEQKQGQNKLSDLTRIEALRAEVAVLEKAGGARVKVTAKRSAPSVSE